MICTAIVCYAHNLAILEEIEDHNDVELLAIDESLSAKRLESEGLLVLRL